MSSTEDPRTSGTQRLAALTLLLLSGLAAGWGVIRAVNSDSANPSMWTLFVVAIALVVTVCGLIAWSLLADPKRALTIWHGIAASLAGVGAGVLLGNATGTGGNERATWFGIGFLVFAALLFLLGLSRGAEARRRANLESDLMRTGTRTTAVVANRGYVEFGESTQVNTPVLFEFTDAEGITRQVEKRLLILPADPIENGQETELWYDPLDPEDWDRIVVQLQREHPAP